MLKNRARFTLVLLALAIAAVPAARLAGAAEAKPPPVKFEIAVTPQAVAAGAEAALQLRLELAEGVKLNKYPKVRLQIPAQEGLVLAAEGSMGNDKPPTVEDMEAGKNYFKQIDPLEMTVKVDPSAKSGEHEIAGKLRVNYCIVKSGICKPAKIPVKIPLTVR